MADSTTTNNPVTLPLNAFDDLILDAGVLVTDFTPAATPSIDKDDIISATTGGITISVTPTFKDFAEDVDNAPNNTLEFKQIDDYECTITTTALDLTADGARLILGAADVDGTNTNLIIPRRTLKSTDFADLWWIGSKADGGYVAVHLINALSTGGFSISVAKKDKGKLAVTFMGHVSVDSPSDVPVEIYVYPKAS